MRIFVYITILATVVTAAKDFRREERKATPQYTGNIAGGVQYQTAATQQANPQGGTVQFTFPTASGAGAKTNTAVSYASINSYHFRNSKPVTAGAAIATAPKTATIAASPQIATSAVPFSAGSPFHLAAAASPYAAAPAQTAGYAALASAYPAAAGYALGHSYAPTAASPAVGGVSAAAPTYALQGYQSAGAVGAAPQQYTLSSAGAQAYAVPAAGSTSGQPYTFPATPSAGSSGLAGQYTYATPGGSSALAGQYAYAAPAAAASPAAYAASAPTFSVSPASYASLPQMSLAGLYQSLGGLSASPSYNSLLSSSAFANGISGGNAAPAIPSKYKNIVQQG